MTTSAQAAPTDGTDKKKLIIAGGVIGALVLGASGYLLLSGGSDDDLALGVPPVRPAAIAPVVKAKVPAKAKPAKVPAVSTVKLGRDPFLALYTVPVVAAVDPAAAPAAPTSTDAGTSTTGTAPAPAAPITAPYSLTLKQVNSSAFVFNVGGTTKSVIASQKFGKYGELVVLTLAKNTKGAVVGALIQVGDDDPVTIKLGEKLTVL